VVEPDEAQRRSVADLLGGENIVMTTAGSGQEAIAALGERFYDCMVTGLALPDMSGIDLVEQIHMRPALRELPVVLYSDKGLSVAEEAHLEQIGRNVVVKEAESPERLLEEATLFLHQVEASLPEAKRRMLEQVHRSDPKLAGKKVLIVDDDVRNIFAITSLLERQRMVVTPAESGAEALRALEQKPDTDLVLMDVMMPMMDGYETMRAIRKIPRFQSLPIVAVTAKAMKGDRERCLEAGASEYITKPVDTQQLLSLLRVWLYRG